MHGFYWSNTNTFEILRTHHPIWWHQVMYRPMYRLWHQTLTRMFFRTYFFKRTICISCTASVTIIWVLIYIVVLIKHVWKMFDSNLILFDEYDIMDIDHVCANFVVCFMKKHCKYGCPFVTPVNLGFISNIVTHELLLLYCIMKYIDTSNPFDKAVFVLY